MKVLVFLQFFNMTIFRTMERQEEHRHHPRATIWVQRLLSLPCLLRLWVCVLPYNLEARCSLLTRPPQERLQKMTVSCEQQCCAPWDSLRDRAQVLADSILCSHLSFGSSASASLFVSSS